MEHDGCSRMFCPEVWPRTRESVLAMRLFRSPAPERVHRASGFSHERACADHHFSRRQTAGPRTKLFRFKSRSTKATPIQSRNGVTATLLNKDVGIMKVGLSQASSASTSPTKYRATSHKPLASIKRLLIDLRGNPGGGIGGLRIMSHLVTSRVPRRLQRRQADNRTRLCKGAASNVQPHTTIQVGASAARTPLL